MRRILLAILASIALVGGISSAAYAGSGPGVHDSANGKNARVAATAACGSTLIFSQNSGGNLGQLNVYWNSCTQKNTAYFNHIGESYGYYTYTSVNICTTSDGINCTGPNPADYGYYRYYAGPVSVYAPRTCVKASGYITWNNINYFVATGKIGCG